VRTDRVEVVVAPSEDGSVAFCIDNGRVAFMARLAPNDAVSIGSLLQQAAEKARAQAGSLTGGEAQSP
jgi:hypothetical protein